MIEGIVDSLGQGIVNPLTQSCHLQSQNVQNVQHPTLFSAHEEYNLDDATYLISHFENFFRVDVDPLFWKKRIITHAVISPSILSVTFLPEETEKCQILFMRKLNFGKTTKGFTPPYLSEQEGQQWRAIAAIPVCHLIYDLQTLDQSVSLLKGREVCDQVQNLLRYFLNDTQTRFLGLTFLDGVGGSISWGWIKP